MKIHQVNSEIGAIIYKCEFCGERDVGDLEGGEYFRKSVVPARICPSCRKNSNDGIKEGGCDEHGK